MTGDRLIYGLAQLTGRERGLLALLAGVAVPLGVVFLAVIPLLQARDPNGGPFGNSGLIFTVGEPGAFTFDKDAPALAISGMPPMRTAPPGSTQRFVLTGGNPSCDTLTVEKMQDIEEPRGCLAKGLKYFGRGAGGALVTAIGH